MNSFDTYKSVRKTWSINPKSRPHSSKKGNKGYDRKETRRIEREGLN